MIDAVVKPADEANYDRLREKIGTSACDTDPEVHNTLCTVLYQGRSVEDALCELVKSLHARAQLAEDTLLVQRLQKKAS